MLARVNAEIERHVDAVDEAMRAAEADMEDDVVWRDKKALRDAALDALDKVVMEREVEVEEGSVGEVERLAGEAGVGCRRLGVSGGTELKIVCGAVKEKWGVGELQKLFHGSLPKALESE